MIAKEQYAEWKHHPATKFFLQYIKDFRESGERAAMTWWRDSPEKFAEMSEFLRGQIATMREIEDLKFEAIEEFYKEEEDGNEGVS